MEPISTFILNILPTLSKLSIWKGKTSHLTFEEASSIARQFSNKFYLAVKSSFSLSDDECFPIQVKFTNNFVSYINSYTGGWKYLNVAEDAKQNLNSASLEEQLWRVYVWIGQNVDSKSSTEFQDDIIYYTKLLLFPALQDSGLSLDKINNFFSTYSDSEKNQTTSSSNFSLSEKLKSITTNPISSDNIYYTISFFAALFIIIILVLKNRG